MRQLKRNQQLIYMHSTTQQLILVALSQYCMVFQLPSTLPSMLGVEAVHLYSVAWENFKEINTLLWIAMTSVE